MAAKATSRQSRDCLLRVLQDEIDALGQVRDYIAKRAKLLEDYVNNMTKMHKTFTVRMKKRRVVEEEVGTSCSW